MGWRFELVIVSFDEDLWNILVLLFYLFIGNEIRIEFYWVLRIRDKGVCYFKLSYVYLKFIIDGLRWVSKVFWCAILILINLFWGNILLVCRIVFNVFNIFNIFN